MLTDSFGIELFLRLHSEGHERLIQADSTHRFYFTYVKIVLSLYKELLIKNQSLTKTHYFSKWLYFCILKLIFVLYTFRVIYLFFLWIGNYDLFSG